MTGFNSWMRLILYVYENNNLDCVILKVIFVYVIVWFRVQFGKKITHAVSFLNMHMQ